MAAGESNMPIIDAHIHLYPASEIPTLAWCTPENPLGKQHSLEEYRAATSGSSAALKGFIFLETDRKHDLETGARDGSGWKYPLMEVSWLKRIVTGTPREGEGHTSADASLCAAIIPWAPLPSGAEAMERYIDLVREEAGAEAWPKVRGFRYLLQNKPNGTMLEDKFIESLRLLGRKGLVFDLGVDQHGRGRIQLEETVEMIDRAHEGVPEDEKVVFVINHMCKPDLEIYNTSTSPSFIAWRTAMFTLSKCDRTYMKLSGGFSEMPAALRRRPADDVFEALVPWLTVLVAAFGPSRIMFASDWPVCTVGIEGGGDSGDKDEGEGGEEGTAWTKWKKIVERLCWMASFDDEQKRMIWGGTALKAYGIRGG